MSKSTCSVDGCTKFVHGQGLCGKHYRRFQRSAEFEPRTIPQCTVSKCKDLAKSRGFCNKHYKRFMRTGSPHRAVVSPEARFRESYEVAQSGCWLWTGGRDPRGYGRITVNKKSQLAHRFSWELAYGPIPGDDVVDHFMCYTPSCVNPDHLRLATSRENNENRGGLNKNNTSGHRGVSWSSERRKWVAYVGHKGRVARRGYFDALEDAAAAAERWRAEVHRPAYERDRA